MLITSFLRSMLSLNTSNIFCVSLYKASCLLKLNALISSFKALKIGFNLGRNGGDKLMVFELPIIVGVNIQHKN